MKHLVFDTETTDLIANSARAIDKQPHIFEIFGLIWNDTDDITTPHHWKIDPGAPISKTATQKTGITNEMVRGRPLFRTIAPAVREMIEQSDCAVAHNFAFDRAMVDLEFFRINEAVAWPKRTVCTVETTEHLQGFRQNLTNLHEFLFNEKFIGAHTAEADACATLRCYRELLKRGEI
jgi:DNA polymerase III subunit epsilon